MSFESLIEKDMFARPVFVGISIDKPMLRNLVLDVLVYEMRWHRSHPYLDSYALYLRPVLMHSHIQKNALCVLISRLIYKLL
jgi:hypothetical protein